MIAIVSRAVEDAKSLVHRTYIYGREPKFNPWAQEELEALKSHIQHDWFGEICSYAGLHQDRVLSLITKIEERAKHKHARAI